MNVDTQPLLLPKHKTSLKPDIQIGKIENRVFKNKEVLTEAQLNHHVHVVGASGFGKTVFLTQIIKQQIQQGKGLLFIDLKNDLDTKFQLTQEVMKAGRSDDLQYFSLDSKETSNPYNLIGWGTATQIRDRIMSSLNWSEEYYKSQSASFLLNALIALCYLRDEGDLTLNLAAVYRAVTDRDYLKELCCRVTEEEEFVKDSIEEAVWFSKDPELWSSLAGLRAQLQSIVKSEFGSLVSSTGKFEIDLFKAVQEGKIIFLFLDTRRYGETAKSVGKFILQDLKSVSARIDSEVEKVNRKPFSVIIDEFADLASEDFIGFLDRARSSKMSIVVSHQEICDLQRISPEFAGRLMGNTSSLYAFLQKRPESADMISGIAGTRTVKKKTYQHQKLFFMDLPTGGSSVREVEEFNIHPNVIKSLRVGEAVVVKKYPISTSYKIKVNQ